MVAHAWDYLWSSARAHSGLVESEMLTTLPPEYSPANQQEWKAYLDESSPSAHIDDLRRNIEKGLPCGSSSFVEKLEGLSNRSLTFRPVGRPKKEEK